MYCIDYPTARALDTAAELQQAEKEEEEEEEKHAVDNLHGHPTEFLPITTPSVHQRMPSPSVGSVHLSPSLRHHHPHPHEELETPKASRPSTTTKKKKEKKRRKGSLRSSKSSCQSRSSTKGSVVAREEECHTPPPSSTLFQSSFLSLSCASSSSSSSSSTEECTNPHSTTDSVDGRENKGRSPSSIRSAVPWRPRSSSGHPPCGMVPSRPAAVADSGHARPRRRQFHPGLRASGSGPAVPDVYPSLTPTTIRNTIVGSPAEDGGEEGGWRFASVAAPAEGGGAVRLDDRTSVARQGTIPPGGRRSHSAAGIAPVLVPSSLAAIATPTATPSFSSVRPMVRYRQCAERMATLLRQHTILHS